MQIDPELEAIKARVKEMEEEAEKIKQMQTEVDKQMAGGSTTGLATVPLSLEEKQEIDTRSVYVGNVDYGASAEELEAHFHGCGTINRVTILCNKSDGHPKGFAYIEFGSKEYVETALAMNETLFRGRQIKVSHQMHHSYLNFISIRYYFRIGNVKAHKPTGTFHNKSLRSWQFPWPRSTGLSCVLSLHFPRCTTRNVSLLLKRIIISVICANFGLSFVSEEVTVAVPTTMRLIDYCFLNL